MASDDCKACIINEDEVLCLYGYKLNVVKRLLTWIITIMTLGIFEMFLYWYPEMKVKVTCDKCPMYSADQILIRDEHNRTALRYVKIRINELGEPTALPLPGFQLSDVSGIRYFTYKKICYMWDPNKLRFFAIHSVDNEVNFSYFHGLVEKGGLLPIEAFKRMKIYGKNLIEVKLKPIIVLLFREASSPLYIFQLFSITVWYMDEYEIYATVIVLITIGSVVYNVYQTRKQDKSLRNMVHSSSFIEVIRDCGITEKIGSEGLVPGDVILIPAHGCIMQCDAVLMNGTVIVNESMLTGESVPVTKVALPETDDEHPQFFSVKEHSRHTLFCGTEVLQTRYFSGKSVKAVVLHTAYSTAKGQLVRSIMYPKPIDLSFTKEILKFIGLLAILSSFGFIYSIIIMIYNGATIKAVILRALDIITIAIPPSLAAVMNVGILAAQLRLKKKKVFCISPSTINTCGAINTVCFDKTGTLTKNGLDFHCLRPIRCSENAECSFSKEFFTFDNLSNKEIIKAISTCHSLTKIDGELRGDPLELALFITTNCSLDETVDGIIEETDLYDCIPPTVVRNFPGKANFDENMELAIIRRFLFSSSLQRMSVIVHNPKDETQKMTLYCKGSPEIISSLCRSESIPKDFSDTVNNYAQLGYRIIAIAYKRLSLTFVKSQRIKREMVESDLEMLGLIILENRLKPETFDVIRELGSAKIRTIMVTGDNILTAISVARECQIIHSKKRTFLLYVPENGEKTADSRTKLSLKPLTLSYENYADKGDFNVESRFLDGPSYQLAISGATFGVLCEEYPELVDRIISVCDVYARMLPDQKQVLINRLQEIEYIVSMCGDGANDCAALKAAHAGISLSETEASIAAPFVSTVPDIRCVPIVIREGRAALVTSFGIFKYMAGYSITQFISVLLLYWIATNLTDLQFLFIDLCLVTAVAIFLGNTPACEIISPVAPASKVLEPGTILSISGQVLMILAFQLFLFIYTTAQPWFVPFAPPPDDIGEVGPSLQGTAIFCLSMFQYLYLAFIYSKGYPYRKAIFSNRPLLFILTCLTIISVWICIYPPEFVIEYLEFYAIPKLEFRLFILFTVFVNVVLAYIYEKAFIEHLVPVLQRWKKRWSLKDEASFDKRFEKILYNIKEPNWIFPYINNSELNNFNRVVIPSGYRLDSSTSDFTFTSSNKQSATFSIQRF